MLQTGTPKAASVTLAAATLPGTAAAVPRSAVKHAARERRNKIHWPYALAEAFFVAYQVAWIGLFVTNGLLLCAAGAAYLALCVLVVRRY